MSAKLKDNETIFSINWKKFNNSEYAYELTPNFLLNLNSKKKALRQKAIYRLESIILDDDYYDVSHHLLPSMPHLFEASKKFEDDEIEYFLAMILIALHILNPKDIYYPIRDLDLSWTGIPEPEYTNLSFQQTEIFKGISDQLEHFSKYLSSSNDTIFKLAVLIISRLNIPTERIVEFLFEYILNEKNPSRKACLYNEFRLLKFNKKVEILTRKFDIEEELVVKSVIASIIASEYGVKKTLAKQLSEELEKYIFNNISLFIAGSKLDYWWIYDFFHDLVIPYSFFNSTKYETLVEYYIEYMTGIEVQIQDDCEIFLAFALGINGKPNYKKLTPLQLQAIKCLFWNKHRKGISSIAFSTFDLPLSNAELCLFFKENNVTSA